MDEYIYDSTLSQYPFFKKFIKYKKHVSSEELSHVPSDINILVSLKGMYNFSNVWG